MDRVVVFYKRRSLPEHCDLPCSKEVDPKRHMGRIIINNRLFCWFCCPSHSCCQIWEPADTAVELWQVPYEAAALELLGQILKGQRPWKDLAKVMELLPGKQN